MLSIQAKGTTVTATMTMVSLFKDVFVCCWQNLVSGALCGPATTNDDDRMYGLLLVRVSEKEISRSRGAAWKGRWKFFTAEWLAGLENFIRAQHFFVHRAHFILLLEVMVDNKYRTREGLLRRNRLPKIGSG